jgi:hypothetical protein
MRRAVGSRVGERRSDVIQRQRCSEFRECVRHCSRTAGHIETNSFFGLPDGFTESFDFSYP